MLKKYYTIGETASLLGINPQTLRYYDKLELLKPEYVDKQTGYRYYTFNQFHVIDRIKYLQSFDMPLEEIKDIISAGSVNKLLPFLENRRKCILGEVREKIEQLDSIQWYIDYFSLMNKGNNEQQLYKVRLEKRYVLAVDHNPGETPIANMEFNLTKAKSRPEFKDLKYLRQYAYLVDFDELVHYSTSLQKRTYWPKKYFIYLKEKPDFESPYFMELPAGEYLCYRARILTPHWDASIIRDFFAERIKPKVVIANEFEENLVEYLDTMYEVQMLLE